MERKEFLSFFLFIVELEKKFSIVLGTLQAILRYEMIDLSIHWPHLFFFKNHHLLEDKISGSLGGQDIRRNMVF